MTHYFASALFKGNDYQKKTDLINKPEKWLTNRVNKALFVDPAGPLLAPHGLKIWVMAINGKLAVANPHQLLNTLLFFSCEDVQSGKKGLGKWINLKIG